MYKLCKKPSMPVRLGLDISCNIEWAPAFGFSLFSELPEALPCEGRCVVICCHEVEQRIAWAIQQRLSCERPAHVLGLLKHLLCLLPGAFPVCCEALQDSTTR